MMIKGSTMTIILMLISQVFVIGCASTSLNEPKAESVRTAISILKYSDFNAASDEIKGLNDVDTLRIIAVCSHAIAWPMEAGYNIKTDNHYDAICMAAIFRLLQLQTTDALESYSFCKSILPNDGCYSHELKEFENLRRNY